MFRSLLRVSSRRVARMASTSATSSLTSSSSFVLRSSLVNNARRSLVTARAVQPMRAEANAEAEQKEKITLTFTTPNEVLFENKEVDMVLCSTIAGDVGLLPNHVPTVAMLKPGQISIHNKGEDTHKFVVSGGFVIMKKDSTASVTAVEAVRVDDLDVNEVKRGLDEANATYSRAKSEKEKVEAQIAVEMYTAMDHAVGAPA